MMTFMFGFFTLQVPAGLTLYWVTSNLLQMLQQWAITDGRFGLGGKKLATATAGAGTAELPAKQASATNGAQPDATGDTKAIATTSENKAAKEPRRRRAKRR